MLLFLDLFLDSLSFLLLFLFVSKFKLFGNALVGQELGLLLSVTEGGALGSVLGLGPLSCKPYNVGAPP